jgi:hypothetical protein
MSKQSRKPIPPLEKHKNCNVEVRLTPTKHYAKYWCVDCQKHVAWLTQADAIMADKLGLIKEGA